MLPDTPQPDIPQAVSGREWFVVSHVTADYLQMTGGRPQIPTGSFSLIFTQTEWTLDSPVVIFSVDVLWPQINSMWHQITNEPVLSCNRWRSVFIQQRFPDNIQNTSHDTQIIVYGPLSAAIVCKVAIIPVDNQRVILEIIGPLSGPGYLKGDIEEHRCAARGSIPDVLCCVNGDGRTVQRPRRHRLRMTTIKDVSPPCPFKIHSVVHGSLNTTTFC